MHIFTTSLPRAPKSRDPKSARREREDAKRTFLVTRDLIITHAGSTLQHSNRETSPPFQPRPQVPRPWGPVDEVVRPLVPILVPSEYYSFKNVVSPTTPVTKRNGGFGDENVRDFTLHTHKSTSNSWLGCSP